MPSKQGDGGDGGDGDGESLKVPLPPCARPPSPHAPECKSKREYECTNERESERAYGGGGGGRGLPCGDLLLAHRGGRSRRRKTVVARDRSNRTFGWRNGAHPYG